MLDISKPLTTGKVQSYYRSEYSSASNSYFSQAGTLRGEWHGQLAPVLKLPGEVTSEAFDRLAEGQHPGSGEQLIKHRDTIKTQSGEELGHRAGWDLTFNAPKTVSLTALVGEDERVREAHRSAVRAALDATEKYVQARLGGNNPAETTGKWIAATFEHDTARPVDGYPAPHLHTHVVVFNMTEDRFGQARSLQPYELFKVQSMSTAIYQNQLEYELRQLGYQIQRGTNHAPDIKGYSPEYLQAESQRSARIYREMEEKGSVGREHRVQLAHQNRDEKLKLTPDELRALHKRSAEEFGNQPGRVVQETSERQMRIPSSQKTAERSQHAVSFARERLSERSAVFEHFEVIRDALRHTHGKARLHDVEAELVRQKEQSRFLEVQHIRPNAPAARYTTPELIQVERETIERVRAGQDKLQPLAAVSYSGLMTRYGDKLNEDQRRLVHDALATRDQIFGIQGGAGTGKTTALSAVRELAQEHGYKVQGLGPTSRAAKSLKEAGIDSETLQAYLTRGRQGNEDARPRLFFIDESSLASGKQMRDFLQTLQSQDRVLLIGDIRQHQSVEAGRIFAELQDAGMNTSKLEKIVRQKDEGLRQVVEAMAVGRIVDGVDMLASQNRIHSVEHRQERLEAIARAYAATPDGTLVVSPDNRSRKELNAAIRDELRETGQLGPDAYRIPVLINRQDVTGEDRGVASSYHVGDSVRYLRGSEALGIEPKSYATVLNSDSDQNQITVKKSNGEIVTYDPGRLKGVSIYEPEIRSFAEGDRVQFTTPWKEKAVSNRDLGTITYLDQHGNIRVQLDDSERTVTWNLRENQHLDYAYAMTSHSSQGATVDQVFIHIDTSDSKSRALIDETLAYVATSRPRYDAQIFTDNEEQLAIALSRSHQNATALSPDEIESYSIAV
ncbi:MAG TPA: MobF family relaxase [Bryobacteraceae bacterium]|jgi:conjugative relaxase-like TrwC/TraI family protein|nr:MobF family relaxase [Bryobacteraceae bacterium]